MQNSFSLSAAKLSRAYSDAESITPNVFSTFKNVNPGIFCRRQLFEVIFANELTENSVELLDGIRKISEKKEINTNVTFITRDEVCEFVKTVEEYNDDFEHPPQFLDNLQRLCSNITGCLVENDEISRKQLALILKHKLINKMYTQYAADAKYDYQMCLQEESLRKLQKAEISKQARFSMLNLDNILSVPEMKPKRPLKKTENPLELKLNDYMSYPLPDNFTGSDDLRDHVLFYVFTGFQDPCLLKLLIRYQVPISCILQVSKNEDVRDSRLNYFWKKLMDMSENKEKYHILEDVAQMKYIYEGLFPDREEVTENFYRERLKELEDILMNILHLKREHLNYIRNIFPFQAEETELRFNNFSFYEAEFEGISAEYITIPFITTSMVKEVEQVLKNNATKDCTLGQSTLEHHCPLEFHNRTNLKPAKKTDKKEKCPFSFEYFKKPIVPKPIVRKRIFKKFYDGDILNMLLVKDKENERMVHSNYEILSKQKLLDITYRFKNLITNEPEVPHFHNQSTPSAKMKLSDDQTNHFLNLLYFTSMTKVKRISPRERSKRYLCNLSDIFASNDFLPKSISHLSNSNLYENFEGMLYRWIEPLTKCTLVQWLYKAQQEFSSNKFRYCDSTRTLLVYFHHNLSPAGTRTRIWNESLRTLTCFRDFCNYYIFEDEKWLSKNPPVKHMRYENYKRNEENYIFQRLLESDNSYDEYKQYLIPYYYCDNFDFQDKLCCAEKDRVKKFAYVPPLVKPNLEEIISELKSYPSKGEIANKCAKTRTSECLLAYDKIPQRFGLIGATNEFFSHDGLKVSVDTCRFHFENFKMKVSLEFNGHTLFGHSQKKRIESHIVLCNGVIITIINPSTHVDNETDSCPCSEDMEQLKSSFSFRQNTALGINQSQEKMKNLYGESFKISNISLRKSEEKYVLPLNSENMNKIHFSPKVLKDRMRKSACKKRIAIITNILRELQIAEECYKYSDYGRYKHKYLYKNQAAYKIPYSSMIKRFLREPLKQKSAPIYRRSIFLKKMIPTKNDDAFNIKICFPNGLILESIPSRIRSTEYTIKQAHMNREKYMDIAKENFRLFFNHGIILISFYNGNMRILDAQGTIVEFKHKDKSQSTLNNHKCLRNMNTCRKVIYRLMKEANKREFSIYGRSRRNHISVSESLRINNKLMKTLNKTDIPFSDIKLFSSDGYLYKIKDDSVKKKIHKNS
ncbi:hypothetical protein HHI36_008208 [Cryptolaemus montrouzieri]|uniref:Uncharacterized protein n=1 Tax=Cryptolaemus montrouzieri TaxID=559131 RepID=A0ABD2MSC5_9CUCU